jgi:hypothetical protein
LFPRIGPIFSASEILSLGRQLHQQGHLARLMELDPKHCDVIVRTWQDITRTIAYLEDGRTFAQLELKRKKTELA